MHASVRKDKPVIARKAIKHLCKSLVPFHITGTLEKLIEHRRNTFFRGKNET